MLWSTLEVLRTEGKAAGELCKGSLPLPQPLLLFCLDFNGPVLQSLLVHLCDCRWYKGLLNASIKSQSQRKPGLPVLQVSLGCEGMTSHS